ncbi:hypothetical protein INT47_007823 [Mucor saturninus]|uniref:Uncharacterized protein n=1 Tax=Mucor saturninus TaxID=64648 RepID=A0A8H7RC99_9FUNG|nr:hypothetical protein INT47_007823 [Mucor saturninus]
MQPWTEKGGSSSRHQSSLNYDHTLSHINQPHQQQQQPSKGFRTARDSGSSSNYVEDETRQRSTNEFSPVYTNNSDMLNLGDGADVMNFLNSKSYSDEVYGDDLRPDSMSYISHRHQMDTQHGFAEKEKTLALLMETEDIVEYLKKTTYTDDIYGIPVLGQYIKEAKEAVENGAHSKIAVERLNMIRNHLVEKSHGDFNLAAQNAFRINPNDWSSDFLDS